MCAAVLLIGSTVLVGCADNGSSTSPPPAPAVRPSASGTNAEAVERLVHDVETALETMVKSEAVTTSDQLRQAFEASGVDPAAIESSLDITPTGLEVDALEAAAPFEGTCVMAQVRDEEVNVTTLPVLESGLCFIGDQR